MVVTWPPNRSFNGKFSDLFEDISETSFVYKDVKESQKSTFRKGLEEKFRIRKIFQGQVKRDFYHDDLEAPDQEHLSQLMKFRQIQVKTVHRFLYPEDFSYLKPRKFIDEEIVEITNKFSDYTVGLHIRRGDHLLAIKNSPIDGFRQQMDLLLEKEERASFFLATDDNEVREFLISRYGKAVITSARPVSRISEEGSVTATIDLFCLSKTSEIWGSKGSSFSETAHHLGKTILKFIENLELV
ncbi:hypothetical protein ACFL1C_00935 [Pseudomonadota bacterium]